MSDIKTLQSQLAELRHDIDELKRTVGANTPSSSLPLVELLLKDNSRRREAEEKLAAAQAWMQLAQENGSVASYSYNVASQELFWSASTYSLYGLTPGRDQANLETWLNVIHPDDRCRVAETANAAIQTGASIDHQFRVVLSDGTTRWITDRGRVELNAEGRPHRVMGVNIDITDLKATQAALAESEARFRHTFENAEVGVAHVGIDGRFLQVNKYLCELLGRPAEELMQMSFEEVTYPEDLPSDLINVRRVLAGEISHYSMEKRYVRRSGEVLWADLSVSLHRNPDGSPANFISIIVDTRQKKRAEERLRLTMGELSHRSKNALAVLEAVVRFSASHAATVGELREALVERLHGMAALQDLLIEQGEAASLRALVRNQLNVFLPRNSPRVVIEGPSVELTAEAVHTVGLAIHELATNACKHGALSSERGSVGISWCTRSDGGLSLRWAERDGPPVEAPTRQGFGYKVLKRMVEVSLGTEARLDHGRAGVEWEVEIPARFILAATGSDRAVREG